MDVGRIEAVLSAKFDKDPFVKYDRALDAAYKDSNRDYTADLDARADLSGMKKYQQGLRQTEQQTRQTETQNRRMGTSLRGIGVAAAKTAVATGALYAAYRGAKSAINSTVELAKESRALNRVSGIELNTASRLVSVLKVRNLTAKDAATSFTILSKQIMAANDGAEKSAKAFAALGVSQEAIRAGDSYQVFLQAADGLSKMENGAQKTALAAQLFGRGYQKLFPILDMGAAGIREQIQLAADMGAELGTNNPKKIMEAIDAQRTMKLALIGLNQTVGKEIIPMLTDAAQAVAKFAKEWRKGTGAGGEAKAVLEQIWNVLDKLTQPLRDHPALIGLLAAAYIGFKATVGALKLADLFMNTLGTTEDYRKGGMARGRVFGAAFTAGAVIGMAYLFVEGIEGAFNQVKGKAEVWSKSLFGPMLGGILDDLTGNGSGVGNFGERIKNGVIGRGVTSAVEWIKDKFNSVRDSIADVFRNLGGRGGLAAIRAPRLDGFTELGAKIGRAIRSAINKIGDYVDDAASLGRRLASGVVSAIGDRLSRLPGRVSSIVRSAVGNVSDAIGRARSAAQNLGSGILNGAVNAAKGLPGKISSIVGRIPGAVRSIIGNAASAGASVGKSVVSAVAGAIRSGASTILNAILSLLPAKLRGPARGVLGLARGGKVGPNSGGPRMFVAGEGGKDEWVISQEGPRAANIAWAVEALETLTGRKVPMFKGGGKMTAGKAKRLQKKVGLPKDFATYWESQIDKIDAKERAYSRTERELSLSQEEYLTSNDDGSVTVNEGAISKRLGELETLKKLREEIKGLVDGLRSWIKETRKELEKMVAALRKARGKAKKKDRKSYDKFIKKYTEANAAMAEVEPDLLDASEDSRIDLLELAGEKAEVEGMRGQGRGPTDPGGGGDGGGEAPPTPEDIARAAREQIDAFNRERSSLFSSFGQNFIAPGGAVTPLVEASGLRYFGGGMTGGAGVLGAAGGAGAVGAAGGGYGSAVNAGAGGVIITNNYAAPPPDPHTWSQGLAWEIRTAV